MTRQSLLFAILATTMGCGVDDYIDYLTPYVFYETKEIKQLVGKFESDHLKYTDRNIEIKNLDIRIDHLNTQLGEAAHHRTRLDPQSSKDLKLAEDIRLGICISAPFATPRIVLNKRFWSKLNSTYKRQLIYHELGHCILQLDHSKDGLMQPYIIYHKRFKKYEEYYLDKFFSHGE